MQDAGAWYELVRDDATIYTSALVQALDDIQVLLDVLALTGDRFAHHYPDYSFLGFGTTGLLQTDVEERRFWRATTWFSLEPPAGLVDDDSWKPPPLPPELFAD